MLMVTFARTCGLGRCTSKKNFREETKDNGQKQSTFFGETATALKARGVQKTFKR